MGHKVKQTKKISNKIEDRTTFFYYAFRNILLVVLPLVFVSAFLLSLPHSSAEGDSNRVDSVTLNLSVSCTVSATELTPHTAVFEGSGLYRENIGTTKVGVFCNDNNGYNIYAIGYGDNTEGNSDLAASSVGSDYNIKTGVYSNGDAVSSWGMKLTAGTGTGAGGEAVTPPTINNGYNNYNVVPSVYTLVASRASSTNMNQSADIDVTGSYFTTTYDIYASFAQPADTYTGKVKYILTHPNTNAPNTINDIDAAFAIAGKQKVYQDANGSYYAMQDMSHDICNSVTRTGAETTTQLVDIRDNKLYYVTKLKDNNCWMTQNLDLDLTSGVALTSELTDLNDSSMSGAYSAGYSYDPNSRIISWRPTNTTRDYQGGTGTGWSNNNNVAYSLDPGNWYWDGDDSTPNCNYLDSTKGCTHFTQNATGANTHLSVGNYYNWSAAIASDGSSSLSSSTYDNITLNPQNSICPKGWRLPTISNMAYTTPNSTSEFGRLNQLYNGGGGTDPKLISAPLWFVRSGYVYYGSLSIPGSAALYWSSTVYSSNNAYNLYFTATGVDPADYSYTYRTIGRSVRCIAR